MDLGEALNLGQQIAQQAEAHGHWVAGGRIASRISWARSIGVDSDKALLADVLYDVIGTSVASQESVVVSFASFLAWFWLLRHYLASRLGVFSVMTPLFGMLFGAWLLDEPIEAGFLVGAIPVLVGIVLVSAGPWLGQIWADTFKARTR